MQALSELVEAAATEIDAASDLAALDAVRVSYLGKKGKLTERLKSLSQLPAEDRPAAGQEINHYFIKNEWIIYVRILQNYFVLKECDKF